MFKKLLFTAVLGLSLLQSGVYAQTSTSITQVGTSAAAFLNIQVGARGMAMGGAFVASANDASALYWNPAGIARLPKGEAMVMHTNWLAGTDFDFGAIVIPLGFGAIGGSITSLTNGDMELRNVEMLEGTGE